MRLQRVFSLVWGVVGTVSVVVLAHTVAEAEPAPFKITADGTSYQIRLGAQERDWQAVSVYFESPGNSSNAVAVEIKSPAGLKLSAEGGLISGADSFATLQARTRIQPYGIRSENAKEVATYTVAPRYSDPTDGYGFIWYHLHKDACLASAKSRYVSQVKLDLSGIDRALYDQTFLVSIAVKELPYKGERASSIKPSSDGKYRGEPILLMSSIEYGNEYFSIKRWSGGRMISERKLPVAKYAYWRGYSLALGRLLGFLTGGKATFELTNGGNIYNACFSLQRRRQKANGYP